MKYLPKKIDFQTKKQLGKYLDLTSYNPSGNRFVCNVCGKKFITARGATNHVDYKHQEKVQAILI